MSLKGVTLHFTSAYPKLVKSQHCFWINVFSPPYNNPDLIELYIFKLYQCTTLFSFLVKQSQSLILNC